MLHPVGDVPCESKKSWTGATCWLYSFCRAEIRVMSEARHIVAVGTQEMMVLIFFGAGELV